jgi:phage pi2 protein 07
MDEDEVKDILGKPDIESELSKKKTNWIYQLDEGGVIVSFRDQQVQRASSWVSPEE